MTRFFREPDVLVRLGRMAAMGRYLAAATAFLLAVLAASVGVRHPALPWMGALASFVAGYNTLNWYWLLRSRRGEVPLCRLQVGMVMLGTADAFSLGAFLYLTGLFASPFFPFVLLAVLFANILSPRRLALYSFGLIALLLVLAGVGVHGGWLPVFTQWESGSSPVIGHWHTAIEQAAWLISLGVGLWFVTFIRRELEAREEAISHRQLRANTLQAFAEEMLDNLPLGVLLLNAGGVIVRVNEIAARIVDLQIPLTYRNIHHLPFFADTGLLAYLKPVFGGASLHLESFPVAGEKGIRSMVMVHAERLDMIGEPEDTHETFVLVALIDVTRRKQMEDETLEIHEQLAQAEKLTAMGQLAAGVAHELNNPLMGIVSSAEFLSYLVEKGISDPDELQEKLGFIKTNAHRIDQLGKKLLGYVRPGRGDLRQVPVQEIVDDAISFTRYDAKRSNVMLRSEVSVDRALSCEKNEIVQILVNLITNAVHACENGEGQSIVVRATENSEQLVVEVEDDGPGIPPDVIEHIWTPFYTTKEEGKGNGLGLAIVQTSVERCSGRISVRTGAGEGTCFHLEIPWEGGESGTMGGEI